MNTREKILAAAVAGVAGLFVFGFGLRALIVSPLKAIDKRTLALREKLDKINSDRRAYFTAEDRIKDHALRAFADTIDQASARSGEMLTTLILRSGLREGDFTRLPVGPRKLRGAEEIGWSVQGDGPLADVVDLIFSLEQLPYIHRLENLSVSAGDSPGIVRLHFRYLTLVIEPAPEVQRKELAPKFALDSPARNIFDGIVSRDILRPYIKRAPPPASSPGSVPPSSPGTPPGPESFRIVSLSEWQGQPEGHVPDLIPQKHHRHPPGDQLAGGTVVCVDYRSLPMPGNEFLSSDSRVILKIGSEFWAIERGRTLLEKHKLPPESLPADLAKAK